MSLIEQIKELAQFDYLNEYRLDADLPGYYKFGWKSGLRFYIDDYLQASEHEGRYVMTIWLNKELKLCQDFIDVEPLIETIKVFLK